MAGRLIFCRHFHSDLSPTCGRPEWGGGVGGGGGGGGEGGGTLLYGLYRNTQPQRLGFSVLVINRVSILAISLLNRVWF